MKNRTMIKLGDVMTFQRGKDLTHSQMEPGRFPVVGSSGIIGWHSTAFVKPPVVLIGRSGTVGRPQLYNREIWAHNTTLYVKNFHGNHPEFCYYFLKNINLENYANSSGVPTLNRNFIHPLKISIPDYPVQNSIAKVLTSIDKKIELNKHMNMILEKISQSVYNYWFLQFDFPNEEGKPYKSSGGEMVYNKKLKREIPEGWIDATLFKNDLSRIISPGVEKFSSKNYLATANVINNWIEDGTWITYECRESRANMQPVTNSVWFAKMKNSVKHLTITEQDNWMINKYILSTGFVGLKSKSYALGYIHCFVNSDFFELHKDRLSHGATQEAVNNNDLKYIKMVIPPKKILEKFNLILLPIVRKINMNIYENMKLIEIRHFLLPLLMNGQVVIDE
ncbi:restriction endonuclease subunit S [Mycoplasmatota bacterium WC44]